jgi:beta-lactam-binding protein with PASTA domain
MDEAPAPESAGGQGRVIAGVAAGVVVLALLGFTVGWLAFRGGDPSSTRSPVVPVSVAPSNTALPAGGLPDYTGQDFMAVRSQLRAMQLGVRLYFGTGDSATVLRTDPPSGTRVRPGLTIKIYVTGAAPLLALPAVVGRACNDGGKALAEAGVYPQYPTGRNGLVVSTAPDASATSVHWNDTVKVVCARPGTSPSPVPSASASSPDPDASPPADSPSPSLDPSQLP